MSVPVNMVMNNQYQQRPPRAAGKGHRYSRNREDSKFGQGDPLSQDNVMTQHFSQGFTQGGASQNMSQTGMSQQMSQLSQSGYSQQFRIGSQINSRI
jgi:hypothetical protein